MMRKLFFMIIFFLFVGFPSTGYSKTFAYMFATDEVIKFDTDTDAIVNKTKSSAEIEGYLDYQRAECAVDIMNNYLITLQGIASGFYVYDVRTMKEISFVKFPSLIKSAGAMKVIYPQSGTRFYIEIDDMSLNSGEGGLVNLAYEKKTSTFLGAVANILDSIRERFWLSDDQNSIYVSTVDGNIRIYDSQTLTLRRTIDLSSIYESGLWSKAVDDVRKGVALLNEYKKTQGPSKYFLSFITYDAATDKSSVRVATGINDDVTLLTPDATRVVVNEARALSLSATNKAPKKEPSATGRLHVYDVKSGNKLGLVTLPTDFSEQILGIRPSGDKLYYLKYSLDESSIRLYVVDLVNLTILKEIPVPNLYFMVFFDE